MGKHQFANYIVCQYKAEAHIVTYFSHVCPQGHMTETNEEKGSHIAEISLTATRATSAAIQ